ncbi:MAG: hypothetical protein NWQ38_04790, partial [Cellulophaga sp.]|nr:hypothetical protein [Cellulophaga sp.]
SIKYKVLSIKTMKNTKLEVRNKKVLSTKYEVLRLNKYEINLFGNVYVSNLENEIKCQFE